MSENKQLSLYSQSVMLTEALIESGGEITEEVEKLFAQFARKVDVIAYVMDRMDIEQESFKKRAAALANIAKGCVEAKERIKDIVKFTMNTMGQTELVGDDVKFKLTESGTKLELDEKLLPQKYFYTEAVRTLDKELLKFDLEQGVVIPGAALVPIIQLRKSINRTVKQEPKKISKAK